MAKNIKTKKQNKAEKAQRRAAQILFTLLAVILILSMALSAVANF
jgi:cell division septal protein FtsQ